MAQLRNKHVAKRLQDLDNYLLDKYKKIKASEKEVRDYATYEREFMHRIKTAVKELEPLINQATKDFVFYKGKGDKSKLTVNQKLRILLIKHLIEKSNRNMAYLMDLFSMISGIDVSYKTIERLYSDPETTLALHNFFILLLEKKEVKNVDATGDATGYSLIVSKHYCSEAKKLKDKIKEQDTKDKKKKIFAYQFAILDLKTRMYVCYGTSLISEKKAFLKAMELLRSTGITINSIRLDKYYSYPSYFEFFPEAKIYIIPKKGINIDHGTKWLETMKEFVNNTLNYLQEYYKRENSESSFGCDKKIFGSKILQKIDERINTAVCIKTIWHNLIWVYAN